MFDYRNRQTTEVKGKRFRQEFECYEMLISKWERGEVRPSGPSLKLLALADSKRIDAIL